MDGEGTEKAAGLTCNKCVAFGLTRKVTGARQHLPHSTVHLLCGTYEWLVARGISHSLSPDVWTVGSHSHRTRRSKFGYDMI
jgi:hypothetical protein